MLCVITSQNYDYLLGGKDSFAADRTAVEKPYQLSRENRDMTRANQRFRNRAERYALAEGIMQFRDLGADLPRQGNMH